MASAWFRVARALAEMGDAWFVLSAKYGLLFPDEEIEDYDLSLVGMSADQRRVWSVWVWGDLVWCLPELPCKVVILAGRLYRQYLAVDLRELGYEVEEPLAHIPGLGRQQRWMEEQCRRLELQD